MASLKSQHYNMVISKNESQTNGVAERSFATSIDTVPVTVQRQPFSQSEKPQLLQPGTARANKAPSVEAPDGTTKDGWAEQHAHQTVLQQHCEFFDPDNDGVIWPLDTYNSFRKLGFGIFLSVLSTFIINGNFAYATQSSWIPDLRFPIYLKNIHKDKHGSDSGTYDHEGRFVPQHFEEIFVKYAGGKDYLTASDLFNLWNCRRVFGDFFGWGGGLFEWLATYLMVWPADGRITKEQIRKMYDGSLFYEIAEQRSREQADARAGRRKAY